MIEQRVIAFALAFPTVGPQRISDELARRKWGSIKISPNGVHKVLRRHGLNTKAKRLGMVAGYAAPYEPIESRQPPPERHIEVDHPGELVQMDCFCIGRLSGAKGTAWQYTPRSTSPPASAGPRPSQSEKRPGPVHLRFG